MNHSSRSATVVVVAIGLLSAGCTALAPRRGKPLGAMADMCVLAGVGIGVASVGRALSYGDGDTDTSASGDAAALPLLALGLVLGAASLAFGGEPGERQDDSPSLRYQPLPEIGTEDVRAVLRAADAGDCVVVRRRMLAIAQEGRQLHDELMKREAIRACVEAATSGLRAPPRGT